MARTERSGRWTTRAATRASSATSAARFDPHTTTGTRGLTNARTRLVGERTGFLADAVVAVVRASAALGDGLRRGFGRVAAVVTALGWAMLAVVPLALGLGYGFGWIELVVAGFVCLAVIVVAVVYLVGRTSVQLALRVPHPRVVVGEPATAEILVTNPDRPRTFGLTVEVPVGAGLAEAVLPGLRKGASFTHEFAVPTARRGVVQVGPVRTVRADPIGIVRREVVWTERAEVFVHPRTIPIPSTSTGFIRDLEGNPTRDLSNNDVSFHALREYVPGDERRYIHWKSTARTGTYMVRQFEETRRSHLVIALSLASADYLTEEEFEMAVSVAGSLGARAIRDARTVTVVASETTPEFAKRKVFAVRPLSTLTRARLLDDLALVEHAESALSIVDVARVTGEQASGVSVAFLVCGSGASVQELRAASTMFPIGVEVVAVVCDPERTPGLRRVAGLSVLTIGYLEDLQKSLARSAAA
ncbi:DUF58 domain-containing protein [Leifsonia sp. H3M29-4]|uniref:DUF58 domain-containing protein n=1 Tax=Salinibacterium metalliresistens TaxID=3031321 RepID=UPI0023DAA611|nr:DUF58 domain-containing protein [Salinibacterium metalliresistens]MDF1480026.1 DUF58 domain-containing protein [Salinibacterium metalliresistens]